MNLHSRKQDGITPETFFIKVVFMIVLGNYEGQLATDWFRGCCQSF